MQINRLKIENLYNVAQTFMGSELSNEHTVLIKDRNIL
jgi:hypothetical protein